MVNERTNQRIAVLADIAVSPRPYIRPTATTGYDGVMTRSASVLTRAATKGYQSQRVFGLVEMSVSSRHNG